MPTNNLTFNPNTEGDSNSTWISKVGVILLDKEGNDIDDSNPLPVSGSLVSEAFDYIGVSYPDTETETYTYKTGGSGGTTVATVTVVYTTSSKDVLSSVTRS